MAGVAPFHSPPVASGSDPSKTPRSICYPKSRLFGTIILWGILGGLIVKLGGSEFSLYVRTFYPRGSDGFRWLSAISDIAQTLSPIARFAPVIAGVVACWRLQRPFTTVVFVGLLGTFLGYTNAMYVMPNPGPNYYTGEYTIPIGCFVGTVVGAVVQVFLWSRPPWHRMMEV